MKGMRVFFLSDLNGTAIINAGLQCLFPPTKEKVPPTENKPAWKLALLYLRPVVQGLTGSTAVNWLRLCGGKDVALHLLQTSYKPQ